MSAMPPAMMSWCLMSSDVIWHIRGQVVTNAEARFNKSHIHKVYACLAVTCHLHFWQNDRDVLRATVVTRGWNGYRNKSQHRKSTLEKKILPPFQQGFEPATFQSRVRRSNHWAIPRPPNAPAIHSVHFEAGSPLPVPCGVVWKAATRCLVGTLFSTPVPLLVLLSGIPSSWNYTRSLTNSEIRMTALWCHIN